MVTDDYKGDFNEIKNNLNKLIESINLLVSDANTLAQAGIDGKLDTRADVSKHGVYPRATSLRWLLMTTRVTSMRLRTT